MVPRLNRGTDEARADASRIVAGRTDGAVEVWDASTGETIRTLSGHANIVTGVAFSADDRLIATASLDGTVKISETATGRLIHTLATDVLEAATDQPAVRAAAVELEVGLWGRNLTDTRYLNDWQNWFDAEVQVVGMPRTFGVSLRWAY